MDRSLLTVPGHRYASAIRVLWGWTWRGVGRSGGEAGEEAVLDLGPLVAQDREDDGVPECPVGAAHVPAQHALASGAEPGDRRLGPVVAQVGLQLHPAEGA